MKNDSMVVSFQALIASQLDDKMSYAKQSLGTEFF